MSKIFREKINNDDFGQRLGSYSHAVKVDIGNAYMIYTTGQLALDASGEVVASGDAEKQAEHIFETISKILVEAGATLNDVVKTTLYVTDLDDVVKISPVRNGYFKTAEPASTLVEVKKLAHAGCVVEIDVVAIVEK